MYQELKDDERTKRKLLSTGQVPVVMDVDDFGFLLPGYDDLLRLKESFPNFRITGFTIPIAKEFYSRENAKHFTTEKYKKWAELVNEQDWIEVAIHGFSHIHHEMETTYDKAMLTLQATENFFEQVGLNYSKIFKAPYWQYSYDALMALRDRGYVIAIDRNHPRPVPPGSKTYQYDWSFEEILPEFKKEEGALLYRPVKGHGHFTGRNKNNIQDTLANILHHLPRDTHFMTIGEYIEKHGTDE
jgi:peptidoglycan/xylan/chitin deacetylase (PgdA/CDA1 family)